MDIFSTALSALFGGIHAPVASQPAYLDPGSGSYLIQLILATLLGGLFVLRASWGRIKAFFRRGTPPEEENQDNDQ